jgi:hypothetical protein
LDKMLCKTSYWLWDTRMLLPLSSLFVKKWNKRTCIIC